MDVESHLILGSVLFFLIRNVVKHVSIRFLVLFSHQVKQELKLIPDHFDISTVDSCDELVL